MKTTLMIMGHPHPENSLSNKLIAEYMKNVDGVSVRTLKNCLKDGEFDVAAEQKALIEAEVIVLQFPFYWFSTPSIIQKWFEDVLLYGFAYGTGGDRLKGKTLLISMTTGGSKHEYVTPEHDHMEVLLQPVRALCEFTQMRAAEDIISYGMTYIPGVSGDKDEVEKQALAHAVELKERLELM